MFTYTTLTVKAKKNAFPKRTGMRFCKKRNPDRKDIARRILLHFHNQLIGLFIPVNRDIPEQQEGGDEKQ